MMDHNLKAILVKPLVITGFVTQLMMTCATSGAGTTHRSVAFEFAPVFRGFVLIDF